MARRRILDGYTQGERAVLAVQPERVRHSRCLPGRLSKLWNRCPRARVENPSKRHVRCNGQKEWQELHLAHQEGEMSQ